MSKYKISFTSQFNKDVKMLKRQKKDLNELFSVITLLADGKTLDKKYSDHNLSGDFDGYRECHIRPDWLLIYQRSKKDLLLVMVRSGSHSDLFG